MSNLPAGLVTFLFTDIEGSTPLWEREPETMRVALERHHAILRAAIEANGGQVFKIIGDAFQAAFAVPAGAVAAALAAQRGLATETWPTSVPIRARMGVHVGPALAEETDYATTHTLNRVARIMSTAHGGQVLLSVEVTELTRGDLPAGMTMRDMGQHRMKGMTQLEHLYQLLTPDLPADFPPLKTLETFPNNLPMPLTSFVGRARELREVSERLAGARLLTLIGPGGTGKTRLSLQVARTLLPQFDGGAWLIELAPLADPAHILSAIATTFGLRELRGQPLEALVLDYMRNKSLLLILDNCEHLIEACAQLVHTFLQACPCLKILASSREGLGIAGEVMYRLPPLSLDEHQWTNSEAIQLFVERAAAVQPGFKLDDQSAPFAAQICARLDGIPLAIELAAARVKLFSVGQIAHRLSDRFRLLVGGSRTALPRQQTLKALIDWSYDLLPDDERQLWRYLSVFAGGWTFEAAEAIAPDLDVLTLLTHLVDKSLVVVDEQTGEGRYRFLETIRQYGRDKLFEAGEAAIARDRHCRFFVAFAQTVWERFRGPEMLVWRERLNREHDNLRAALEWGLEHDPQAAQALIANIASSWGFDGFGTEAQRWLKAVREKVKVLPEVAGEALRQRQSLLARGLQQEGMVALNQGDSKTANAVLQEAIGLARLADDKLTLAYSLSSWSLTANFLGITEGVEPAAHEALALTRTLGDKWGEGMALLQVARVHTLHGELDKRQAHITEALRVLRVAQYPMLTSMMLMGLGVDATMRGDFEAARQHFTEALTLFQQQKNKQFANVVLSELGHIARHTGDLAGALATYQQTLRVWKDLGQRAAIAHQLECVAFIAIAQAHFARAAQLLGAAEALRALLGAPMMPQERRDYEREIAHLRAGWDEKTFASLWAEGQALTMEQAIELALMESA